MTTTAWPSRVYGVSTTTSIRGSVRTSPVLCSAWLVSWYTWLRHDRSGVTRVGGDCDGDSDLRETEYARMTSDRTQTPRATKNVRVSERCRRRCRKVVMASSAHRHCLLLTALNTVSNGDSTPTLLLTAHRHCVYCWQHSTLSNVDSTPTSPLTAHRHCVYCWQHSTLCLMVTAH